MKALEQLETKIRQLIPELNEEWEVFQEGAIDLDMITPIMLNHVLDYFGEMFYGYSFSETSKDCLLLIRSKKGTAFPRWNLKSSYLKD